MASSSSDPARPEVEIILQPSQPVGEADGAGSSQHRRARGSSQPQVQIPKVRCAAGDKTTLFAPLAVPIGPYYRSQAPRSSFPLEEEKKKVLHDLRNSRRYPDLKRVVDELERQARECYNTTLFPSMDSEEFSEMLLRDCCYLLKYFTDVLDDVGEQITKDNTMVRDILYLRGNQIPMFVLERMLDLLREPAGPGGDQMTALECIAGPVEQLLQQQFYISKRTRRHQVPPDTSDLLHLVYSYFRRPAAPVRDDPSAEAGPCRWATTYLHQVYSSFRRRLRQEALRPRHRSCLHKVCSCFLQMWQPRQQGEDLSAVAPGHSSTAMVGRGRRAMDWLHAVFHRQGEDLPVMATGRWRRATYYNRYADLRFRRRPFSSNDVSCTILDIDLRGGTLYVPFLLVGSGTWTMLRNLMTLEEQEAERPVTAYCYFMSQVASTAEDIDLLQRANVLRHFMGTDEMAAEGFANLCNGAALSVDNDTQNYLKPLWHRLDKRCKEQVHIFAGFFRNRHCSNVFYVVLFFVSVIVFACQVTQTIYAVIGHHITNK